jgi:hypothetical protein
MQHPTYTTKIIIFVHYAHYAETNLTTKIITKTVSSADSVYQTIAGTDRFP